MQIIGTFCSTRCSKISAKKGGMGVRQRIDKDELTLFVCHEKTQMRGDREGERELEKIELGDKYYQIIHEAHLLLLSTRKSSSVFALDPGTSSGLHHGAPRWLSSCRSS